MPPPQPSVTRLNTTQLRRLNRVVLALHEESLQAHELEPLIDLIEQLLPVSCVSIDEASLRDGSVRHRGGRRLESIPQLDERIAQFCHQNPLIVQARDGNFSPAKISDFVTFHVLQRTAFYQEIARFLPGWRDQAAVPIQLPGVSLGFALNRDRPFTSEELLMLELLQPHLQAVLYRCTQYLELATQSPLTPREREVLHWVSEGKRDADIACILKLSVRTVEQHVHACLRKLGVETRAAGAAEVWRARNRTGAGPDGSGTAVQRQS